jgi:hypothetical protein
VPLASSFQEHFLPRRHCPFRRSYLHTSEEKNVAAPPLFLAFRGLVMGYMSSLDFDPCATLPSDASPPCALLGRVLSANRMVGRSTRTLQAPAPPHLLAPSVPIVHSRESRHCVKCYDESSKIKYDIRKDALALCDKSLSTRMATACIYLYLDTRYPDSDTRISASTI